jgi:hypothetical protein
MMTAPCLFGDARAAGAPGAHALAANLLGAAGALYDASGTRMIVAAGADRDALVSATRAALGGDRFEAERQHGATLATADVIDLALSQLRD